MIVVMERIPTWIVADTMFALNKDGNLDARSQEIVDAWRNKVNKDDIILHLGGLVASKKSLNEVAKLPGHIMLLKTAEDRWAREWYEEAGVKIIREMAPIDVGYWRVRFSELPDVMCATNQKVLSVHRGEESVFVGAMSVSANVHRSPKHFLRSVLRMTAE